MTAQVTVTIRRIFTTDAATLPIPVKVGFGLALILVITLVLAVSGDLEYRSLDVALAGEAMGEDALGSGGPVTTCSADGQEHSAPYVVTFTVMNQYGSISDTFYSADDRPFVSGMLISLREGTHTLRFYSTDGAGRAGPTTSATITVR